MCSFLDSIVLSIEDQRSDPLWCVRIVFRVGILAGSTCKLLKGQNLCRNPLRHADVCLPPSALQTRTREGNRPLERPQLRTEQSDVEFSVTAQHDSIKKLIHEDAASPATSDARFISYRSARTTRRRRTSLHQYRH